MNTNDTSEISSIRSMLANRLTRRTTLKRAAAAGLGVPLLGSVMAACDVRSSESAEKAAVNQVKRQRSSTGVLGHNSDKASPGYTLFTPLNGTTAYLIDMDGDVEHSWDLPYPPGLYGYLTPQGTLLYNAQLAPEDVNEFLGEVPFRGGAVLEIDWDGNVLNETKHQDHHHDGIRLSNGNLMLLCLEPISDDIASSVSGGAPDSEWNGLMHADYIVEVTPSGEEVWRWNSWDHLDPQEDGITAVQDTREEWTHGNAVSEMSDGNLLVSFRNNSTVVMVDRQSGEMAWKLGGPPLAQQHAPNELENGNILIFDNGTHRLDFFLPYSQVVEVDPETSEIVWSYSEANRIDFFSPLISNAQRLPNGNTLICEGNSGRFFEVTVEGEVVWEYISPYFHPNPQGVITNNVFRCYRYSEEEIEMAREQRG